MDYRATLPRSVAPGLLALKRQRFIRLGEDHRITIGAGKTIIRFPFFTGLTLGSSLTRLAALTLFAPLAPGSQDRLTQLQKLTVYLAVPVPLISSYTIGFVIFVDAM